MKRKLSKEDVAKSSSVFWSHADNVLSSNAMVKEDLRLLLNLHSLFSEHLCVLDICLLNNDPLRELIMYEGYDALLSDSTLVPMLRSSVKNFEELEYQSRVDETTYGMLQKEKAQHYGKFLDDEVSTILPTKHEYFKEALTENFENSLLNSGFLHATGLSQIETKLQKYIKTYLKRWGTNELRRSVFFFFGDELTKEGHPRYAARVKCLSSAIYNNTFTHSLNLKPSFPHTYSEILLDVLTPDKNALRMNTKYSKADQYNEVSLGPADLRVLTANDIIRIRKTNGAKSYFKKAKRAAQESDPFKSCEELKDGISLYLPSIDAEISSIGTGRRKRRSRMQNRMRLCEWTNIAGGSGIALGTHFAGGDPIGSIIFGIIWCLADSYIGSKLSEDIRKEDLSACEQWKRIKESQDVQRPIINVLQMGGGKKKPLF
jgi:hypothetical protein